jgi:Flp pilus assembly pilin Flp
LPLLLTFEGKTDMQNLLKRLWQEEEGQDLVEYTLLLAFVALAGVNVTAESLRSSGAVKSAARQAFDTSVSSRPVRGNAAPRIFRPFPGSSGRSLGSSAGRREVALNSGKRYVEMSCA